MLVPALPAVLVCQEDYILAPAGGAFEPLGQRRATTYSRQVSGLAK
jgi:hypothetical protein